MEQKKGAENINFVDLKTFNPHREFVPKLRVRINIPESPRDQFDPIGILLEELDPTKLHIDAIKPSIDAVLSELEPTRRYGSGEEEMDRRKPAERAVYEYLKEITNTEPERLRDDMHRTMQDRYIESANNYSYFEKFQTLKRRRESGKKTISGIESNWTKMQERRPEEEKIDEERIAENWRTLRGIIKEEVELNGELLDRARSSTTLMDPYSTVDPRFQGFINLEQANVRYNIMMKAIAQNRDPRLKLLETILGEIVNVPGQVSAEVLWRHVLTDEEKHKIQEERIKYRKADSLIKESEYFLSYKEKAFHEFDSENSAFHDTWSENMLAVNFTIGNVEKILVGDISTAPSDTKKILNGEDADIIDYFHLPEIEAKKRSSKLHGYLADVTTAFLKRDQDKDQASN